MTFQTSSTPSQYVLARFIRKRWDNIEQNEEKQGTQSPLSCLWFDTRSIFGRTVILVRVAASILRRPNKSIHVLYIYDRPGRHEFMESLPDPVYLIHQYLKSRAEDGMVDDNMENTVTLESSSNNTHTIGLTWKETGVRSACTFMQFSDVTSRCLGKLKPDLVLMDEPKLAPTSIFKHIMDTEWNSKCRLCVGISTTNSKTDKSHALVLRFDEAIAKCAKSTKPPISNKLFYVYEEEPDRWEIQEEENAYDG